MWEKAGNYWEDRVCHPLYFRGNRVKTVESEKGEREAVCIMTRCVSFETTCKQRCKHSEGKGWKQAVEWEESLRITGGRRLILVLPSIPAEFNSLLHTSYFQKETRSFLFTTLRKWRRATAKIETVKGMAERCFFICKSVKRDTVAHVYII